MRTPFLMACPCGLLALLDVFLRLIPSPGPHHVVDLSVTHDMDCCDVDNDAARTHSVWSQSSTVRGIANISECDDILIERGGGTHME